MLDKPKNTTKKKSAIGSDQSERFKETARKLGSDERPEEFEKVLMKIAKSKADKKLVRP